MQIGLVTLDCASLGEGDVVAVDLIASIRLAAKRRGVEVHVVNADAKLVELIDLCGLAEPLRVEVRGQAEEREQPHGVEEERELADPPA